MALLVALLICNPRTWAQAGDQDAGAAEPRLESVRLVRVESDRVRLAATVSLRTARPATISMLVFSSLRIEGLPAYAAPIQANLVLRPNEPAALPPIDITLYFRDMTSSAPIKRMIEEQKVSFSASVSVTLVASLVEKLALHSLHPKLLLFLNTEAPVHLPGGPLTRTAALVMVDAGWKAAATARSVVHPDQDTPARNQFRESVAKHLVEIRTTYNVARSGDVHTITFSALGFWVAPSLVLVPDEALRPWEFAPDLMEEIVEHRANINKNEAHTVVRSLDPSGPAIAWTMDHGDFTLEHEGNPPQTHLHIGVAARGVTVRVRASNENYALLHFKPEISGQPLQRTSAPSALPEKVAVFRQVVTPGSSTPGMEVVYVAAAIENQHLRLNDPIDDAALGSPILTSGGDAIGFVQEEGEGALFTQIKTRSLPPLH